MVIMEGVVKGNVLMPSMKHIKLQKLKITKTITKVQNKQRVKFQISNLINLQVNLRSNL